jgi:hypothetical protein
LQKTPLEFTGSRHFFAVAAEAMRRILVENVRRKNAAKRGGERRRVDLDEANLPGGASADELVLLDEALTRLTNDDSDAAEIAKLARHEPAPTGINLDPRTVAGSIPERRGAGRGSEFIANPG